MISAFKRIGTSRKSLLAGASLVLLFSLVPLSFAHAGLFDSIVGGIVDALAFIPAVIIGAFATMAGAIFKVVAGIFLELIQYLLDISVLPGSAPDFVNQGWRLARNLANIFFILVLVFIGLATILRLQTYQMQRTLPALILVALLVNFSGVLVALIVDFSNLLTNFFLHEVIRNTSWSVGKFPSFGEGAEALILNIANLVFFLFATFIFFAVILAFLYRTIMLWVLTIVAPVAFLLYVLPNTRSITNGWWSNVLRWALFPIPMAFFLYIGGLALSMKAPHSDESTLAGAFAPITALFILWFGLMFSWNAAPKGAQNMVKFSRNQARRAGDMAASRYMATKRGKEQAEALTKTRLGTPEDFRKELREAKGIGKAGVLARQGLGTALKVSGARWAVREAGRRGLQYATSQPGKVDERVAQLEKEFKGDTSAIAATFDSQMTSQGKIAVARALTKKEGTKGFKKLTEMQQRQALRLAGTYDEGRFGDLAKYARHLTVKGLDPRKNAENEKTKDLMINKLIPKGVLDEDAKRLRKLLSLTDEKEILRKTLYKKLVGELKTSDLDNEDPSTILDDADMRQAVAMWKPWSFVRRIGEEFGLDSIRRLQQEAQRTGLQTVAKANPTFVNAAKTAQGQLIMDPWEHPTTGKPMDPDDIRNFMRDVTRIPDPLRNELNGFSTALTDPAEKNQYQHLRGQIEERLIDDTAIHKVPAAGQQARIKELYERLSKMDNVKPYLPETITEKQRKQFGEIARGVRPGKTLQDHAGAMMESLDRIETLEQDPNWRSDPARVSELSTEMSRFNAQYSDLLAKI